MSAADPMNELAVRLARKEQQRCELHEKEQQRIKDRAKAA